MQPIDVEAQKDPKPPKTVLVGAPIQTVCEPLTVKHWDKIIFTVTELIRDETPNAAEGPTDLVAGQAYDIKVPDTVGKIADLHAIVVADLIGKGYVKEPANPINPTPSEIIILDVEYTTFCIQP